MTNSIISITTTSVKECWNWIQEERDSNEHSKLGRHAVGMLIAGPILWVVGSIHNSCQVYHRADAHLQILQQGVHVPFLIASVLFAAGSIINARHQAGLHHRGRQLLVTKKNRLYIFIYHRYDGNIINAERVLVARMGLKP